MLLAAGLEVPKQVFAHGWLLVGGEKMSKSKLTGIAPHQITDVFGSDAFRYYFLRAIPFGQDGSFSWEDLSARYQAELANGFGNLASRVHRDDHALPRRRGAGGGASPPSATSASARPCARAAVEADLAIERMAPHEAVAAIWTIVEELNGYITLEEPWKLVEGPGAGRPPRLGARDRGGGAARARRAALAGDPEGDRRSSGPRSARSRRSAACVDQRLRAAGDWGQLPAGTQVSPLEPLFPRIDPDVLDA